MDSMCRLLLLLTIACASLNLSAQMYGADRMKRAADKLDLKVATAALSPDTTLSLVAKDGQKLCLRTGRKGEIAHIGIPLFNEVMRYLQPSPVYDFLEFALLNWKYKITDNRLYLSKVLFRQGTWETLLREHLSEYGCSVENKDDKLYVVSWKDNDRVVAALGIPIEYELLNNDTRRNIERAFIKELEASKNDVARMETPYVKEEQLSICGTEGLFVLPGKTYLIDLLNQNVYYKLTTICEEADTVIRGEAITMKMESVVPVVVYEPEFLAESLANLVMCDDRSVPEATVELDFHLSNYHRKRVTIPYSQLKSFCQQRGCEFYFAYNGTERDVIRGVMFVCNPLKGYNHLISLHLPVSQLMSATPTVQADVYLYIPPIEKDKLFGKAPTKKSGAKFKLP